MIGQILYDASIRLYTLAIGVAAWRNKKAQQWIEGRHHWQVRLKQAIDNQPKKPLAWFHCASLGEFEQGRPVIEAFKENFPDYQILLTFFSPSGYEIRKNYEHADYICYLPADTAANAQLFVEITQPKIAFFVKYEFWHHYVQALKNNNSLLVSFSAIFRANQLFFKQYGGFYSAILQNFDQIFVQNTVSENLLKSINLTNVCLGGDTRFDRVARIAVNPRAIPLAAKFRDTDIPLLIVGSAWPQDMAIILPVINRLSFPIKLIVAPHEIDKTHIAAWQAAFHQKSICFSEANETTINQYDMLIIDNVGMLSALYRYADFAWIGGAFGKGLHNTLEAATFGMPIFFGNKNYTKFQEAQDLIALGAAFPLATEAAFETKLKELQNITLRYEIASKARNYIQSGVGSTEQIIAWCKYKLL